MGVNDDIKNDLKPFWKKVIPFAIVGGVMLILGIVIGLLAAT